MINFNFQINRPFYRTRWRTFRTWHGMVFKNKAWEINFYGTGSIISINFDFTVSGDHRGIRFQLGLFGRECEFNFYDVRHWERL